MAEVYFTDQLDRKIEIPFPPQRIISLVPSQSELLWDLGLKKELIGITKFCVHPNEMFRSVARVGGTKTIATEKIKALKPDLIIANKEENEQEQVEELIQHFPVWVSDIKTLDDALNMINILGAITKKNDEAQTIAHSISENFAKLRTINSKSRGFTRDGEPFSEALRRTKLASPLQTAYLIWKNPFMAAGKGTFIDDMLGRCGLENIFTIESGRYPEATLEEILIKKPELILLSSEPYPFKEKHIREIRSKCPDANVLLADGEFFSWYGSRLIQAPAYFMQLLRSL